MSDAWFQEQIAPEGVTEDGCDPLEAQALKDYFESDTSPKDAALTITRPITKKTSPSESVGSLWGLLANAMMELSSEKRAKTIELIKEMQNFDLGGLFSWTWMDCYRPKLEWRDKLREDARAREEYRAEYQKIALIEAEMIAAGVEYIELAWGLRCIAGALESSQALLEIEVPAAYEWVRIAGKHVEAAMHAGKDIWTHVVVPNDLYHAPDAPDLTPLTPARVLFWIERLRTLPIQHDLDSYTRDCARASAENMHTWVETEVSSAQVKG